jgi:hypothetical protein
MMQEAVNVSRVYLIPQRDFSDVKAQLNSVGWFMPPYVSVGFLEMVALRVVNGGAGFTQNDLEEMLAFVYGPERLSSMVLNRYPLVPVIALYAETISEAIWAHFAGLHHVAVGGLIPVVEGAGRRLAGERGLKHRGSIKEVFRSLAAYAKDDVVRRRIGATAEIVDMLDSFSCFIEAYFYASSEAYPLVDGTNRHGVAHGAYTDAEYGRPLNFYKTIAAIDFLTFISSLTTTTMSGFVPDYTPESKVLAARYVAAKGLSAV